MRLHEIGSKFDDKLIIVDGFFVDRVVVEDISIAEDNLIIFGVFVCHISVPWNPSLVLGVGQAAKRKCIIWVAFNDLFLAFFPVPSIRIPLIVPNLFLIITKSIDIVIFFRRSLNDLLVDLNSVKILLK